MNEHFYKTLKIENFRGIKTLEINDLARVNLFVGKNNCGKTSVLESVFLLTGIAYPSWMISMENMRGITLKESSDLRDFFYERNHERGIKFVGTQRVGNRRLAVSPMFGDLHTRQVVGDPLAASGNGRHTSQIDAGNLAAEQSIIGLKYNFAVADKAAGPEVHYESMTRWTQLGGDIGFAQTPDGNYKEAMACRFIGARAYDHELVDKMLNAKRKEPLLHSLRVVDPKIQDIKTGAGGFVSVDIGLDSFIPINLLGQGASRILNILSSIDGMRDGALVVDEIDNGLHVSAIRHMWEMILEHSAQCRTQIFATTHNGDVVRFLAEVSGNELFENDDAVACFALEKLESDVVRAFRYSSEDLMKSRNSDIDVRG